MPYVQGKWEDGKTGSTFEATAAKFQNMENGILAGVQGIINVREPPFNAKGNGTTNDATAINEALTLAGVGGEEFVVLLPLGAYACTNALKIPANVRLMGQHRHGTRLIAKGNINLIEVTAGDSTIENLSLEAETKQTSGSAIDLSHGFSQNLLMQNLMIGDNFFNGLFLVGNIENIGGIYGSNIRFENFNHAVKGYGNAAIVLGNGETNKRVNVAQLVNIHGQANEAKDMPKWFEVNNTDSLQMSNVMMQTGEEGLVIGNKDTSAKRSTNLEIVTVIADGCTLAGFKIASSISGEMTACHAEQCGEGVIFGASVSGFNVIGGNYYHCSGHGIRLLSSSAPTNSINIAGASIQDNGENAEAGRAGVFLEEKAGGLLLTGNTIGNPVGVGGGLQKVGVSIGAKCENVGVFGNRFVKNVTAGITRGTETVGVKTVAEMEAQNLMV
jgi:hypothetical protein